LNPATPDSRANASNLEQKSPGYLGLAAVNCSPERRLKAAIISESGQVVWWIDSPKSSIPSFSRWCDLVGQAVYKVLTLDLRNEALYLLSNSNPLSNGIESIWSDIISPLSVPSNDLDEYTVSPSASKNSDSLATSESSISKECKSSWLNSALSNLSDMGGFMIWDGGKSVVDQANASDQATASARRC
jgi:hypothetical protein